MAPQIISGNYFLKWEEGRSHRCHHQRITQAKNFEAGFGVDFEVEVNTDYNPIILFAVCLSSVRVIRTRFKDSGYSSWRRRF